MTALDDKSSMMDRRPRNHSISSRVLRPSWKRTEKERAKERAKERGRKEKKAVEVMLHLVSVKSGLDLLSSVRPEPWKASDPPLRGKNYSRFKEKYSSLKDNNKNKIVALSWRHHSPDSFLCIFLCPPDCSLKS